jgi:cysteinyl-tRNA synthetase
MSVPDSVTQLAQARMDARAAKDFKLADKYSEELLHAGYEFVDVAEQKRQDAFFAALSH